MKLARGICYLFSFLLVLTGIYLLVLTEDYMEMIGATAPAGIALSDMRAVFGGLELALGIVLFLLARRDRDLPAAALLTFAIFAGLVLGRIYEIVVNGFPEEQMFTSVTIFEVSAMIAGFIALRAARTAAQN